MPNLRVSAAGGAMSATAFITVTPAMRLALESLVDDLVLLLDEIDGDADFEGMNEDGTDQDIGEHDDSEELEHTANESAGRGFALNRGPREDDAEDGHDREWDQAEQGIADNGGLDEQMQRFNGVQR